MIVDAPNEQFLMMVYLMIALVIPGIVLWFDDGKIHSNQAK